MKPSVLGERDPNVSGLKAERVDARRLDSGLGGDVSGVVMLYPDHPLIRVEEPLLEEANVALVYLSGLHALFPTDRRRFSHRLAHGGQRHLDPERAEGDMARTDEPPG